MTTIECGLLSASAAETIARALFNDSEDDAALALLVEYGESVIMADDGNAEVEMTAKTLREAAQEYVDDGDWGDSVTKTDWITVRAWRRWTLGDLVHNDDDESFDIELEPEPPGCSEQEGHDWCSPHAVVGGLRENPGVQGHGGGVICHEVCRHCGVLKITDTWAQNPSNGAQGLTSIEYKEFGEHEYTQDWQAWADQEENEP